MEDCSLEADRISGKKQPYHEEKEAEIEMMQRNGNSMNAYTGSAGHCMCPSLLCDAKLSAVAVSFCR
jgi:hypothetical protein